MIIAIVVKIIIAVTIIIDSLESFRLSKEMVLLQPGIVTLNACQDVFFEPPECDAKCVFEPPVECNTECDAG
jgi:hypothetical protein